MTTFNLICNLFSDVNVRVDKNTSLSYSGHLLMCGNCREVNSINKFLTVKERFALSLPLNYPLRNMFWIIFRVTINSIFFFTLINVEMKKSYESFSCLDNENYMYGVIYCLFYRQNLCLRLDFAVTKCFAMLSLDL